MEGSGFSREGEVVESAGENAVASSNQQKNEAEGGSMGALFMSVHGMVHNKAQFDQANDWAGGLNRQLDVLNSQDGGFQESDDVTRRECVQTKYPSGMRASWFELTEEGPNEYPALGTAGRRTPRSSLKLVDEALEFEVGCMADRGIMGEDGFGDDGLFTQSQAISYVEPDEELNELAAKCFDSNPDMNVLLRKLRDKEKKSIVVLERRTRSKNFL